MKPPRLPGTEKFRFCDKKFEQNIVSGSCQEEPSDNSVGCGVVSAKKLNRKDSFLFAMQSSRSLSNESFLCSYASEHSHRTEDSLDNGVSSCALEELMSQANLQMARYEHNKRKPHLPISSRLTSRVFNLTNGFSHSTKEVIYYRKKGKEVFEQDSLAIPRARFAECFDSSSSRSSTPTSMDSRESASAKQSETKCGLHSAAVHLRLHGSHNATNLLINSTSHASLMSDESSTSMSSAQPTDCDDSLRSCSCSPVEHWAKQTTTPNRLSTSSQSSWEDGSDLHGVT